MHLTSPRALLSLLLLMAVAGAVMAWWLHEQRPLPAAGVSGIERQRQAVTAILDADATIEVAPPAIPALERDAADAAPAPLAQAVVQVPPDADALTVLELLELFEDAALAGNVAASCLLSQALGECARYRDLERMRLPPPDSGASREAIDIHVEEEARREEALASMAPLCAGVGLSHLARRMDFTARAARAGHVASLLDVVRATPADFVRHPQLAPMYRSEVWPLLRAAMAAGHERATLTAMFQIQSPATSPLWSVLPEQFQDAWAARAVILMVYPQSPHQRQEDRQPSAEAQATARRWIDELMGGTLPTPTAPGTGFRRAREDEACDNPTNWIEPAS
jgi:hypothetical protein